MLWLLGLNLFKLSNIYIGAMSKYGWYNKILLISIGGALFYWLAESLASYFLFDNGSLAENLWPIGDIHEFYMRAIVAIVIVIIGLVIRNRAKESLTDAQRIEHLNRILSAIGDVNQLILREHNPHQLLEQVCHIMVRDRGYFNCWIVLVDSKGKVEKLYSSGLEGEEENLGRHLKQGGYLNCLNNLKQDESWSTDNTGHDCQDCILCRNYNNRGALSAPLKRKKTYGYMVVSISQEFVNDAEEKALFAEVAADIALALENIELEALERNTEKRLMQTAQKFLDLFNLIDDAIFIHDLEGHFLEVNDQACRRLGYSKEELLKLSVADIDSPEFSAKVTGRVEKIMEEGQAFMESAHITKKGDIIPVELNSQVINYQGRKAILTVARDITERKKNQEQINRLVYYDPLTGLPNRRMFGDRIEMALANAQRNKNQVAVAMLDLDGFKDINDALGHTAGDEFLIKVAKRIESAVRKSDTVARLGGDEFICLFTNLVNRDNVARVADKIIRVLDQPINIDSRMVSASISMGIALYPEDGNTAEELIKKADIALYRVKNSGKKDFAFYMSS